MLRGRWRIFPLVAAPCGSAVFASLPVIAVRGTLAGGADLRRAELLVLQVEAWVGSPDHSRKEIDGLDRIRCGEASYRSPVDCVAKNWG